MHHFAVTNCLLQKDGLRPTGEIKNALCILKPNIVFNQHSVNVCICGRGRPRIDFRASNFFLLEYIKRKALWQIDLHPGSKYLTSFIITKETYHNNRVPIGMASLTYFMNTKGTYHNNRVPIGMASSGDIFQKVME